MTVDQPSRPAAASSAVALSADEVVRLLELAPHPEGGHYRETFRDSVQQDGRSVSTAIYFLLGAGEVSRWHRVDAAEAWHWYAGAPLRLDVTDGCGDWRSIRMGADLVTGERPQAIVPAGWWQQAQSLGAWSLMGCTVAPGFVFSGFEMAKDDWQPQRP